MVHSYDETHWYGYRGWRHLRRAVSQVAVQALDDLLEAGRDSLSFETFGSDLARSLVAAIEARRADYQAERAYASPGASDYSPSKWDYALALFDDVAALEGALQSEILVLTGRVNRPVDAKAALGEVLRRYLEGARRRQSPATLHRQTTWEAIDRVSLEIAREASEHATVDRCSEVHIAAVRQRLAERYPTNKNYNVSQSTLRSYFLEFSPEATEAFGDDDLFDGQVSRQLQEDFSYLPPVELCMDKLQSQARDLWEALVIKLQLDDLPKTSIGEYMQARALTRHRFDKRYNDAIARVRDCVENAVAFNFGRRG